MSSRSGRGRARYAGVCRLPGSFAKGRCPVRRRVARTYPRAAELRRDVLATEPATLAVGEGGRGGGTRLAGRGWAAEGGCRRLRLREGAGRASDLTSRVCPPSATPATLLLSPCECGVPADSAELVTDAASVGTLMGGGGAMADSCATARTEAMLGTAAAESRCEGLVAAATVGTCDVAPVEPGGSAWEGGAAAAPPAAGDGWGGSMAGDRRLPCRLGGGACPTLPPPPLVEGGGAVGSRAGGRLRPCGEWWGAECVAGPRRCTPHVPSMPSPAALPTKPWGGGATTLPPPLPGGMRWVRGGRCRRAPCQSTPDMLGARVSPRMDWAWPTLGWGLELAGMPGLGANSAKPPRRVGAWCAPP